MKKKWLSALLAVSMLLSPSYLFAGNAQALSVGAGTSKMVHAAPIDQEVYEAEEAVLMGATLAENLDDFSGNGFVDGMRDRLQGCIHGDGPGCGRLCGPPALFQRFWRK